MPMSRKAYYCGYSCGNRRRLRYGAVLCGRGFFLLSVFLFSRFTALTAATVWKQIKLGIQWLLLQAVIVPLSVIILNKLLVKEKQNDRS